MKTKLIKIFAFIILLVVCNLQAQTTNLSNSFVNGSLDIKFNSKNSASVKGVKDIYKININVSDSVLFIGTVTDQPQIIEGVFSKSVAQPRILNYNVECNIINPAWKKYGSFLNISNRSQVVNVGRLYGDVPIGSSLSPNNGTYLYDQGNLTVDILPIGRAQGFSSKFSGIAVGKPMSRPQNWLDNFQSKPVNITKTINGKVVSIALNKYDKMEFRNQVLGAGPIAKYTPVTINGEIFFDYDKNCWFFNNFTMQYSDTIGNVKIDRITGTIRWDAKTSQYDFDIRVNEPLLTTASAFDTAAPIDASAFFETDNTLSALNGAMIYKDTKLGDIVLSSQVKIELVGNKLSPEQTMALSKMIIFSMIIPMNAD